MEAVCSIIYAAPLSEVKELIDARNDLQQKFGTQFIQDATLNKNNCVNARVLLLVNGDVFTLWSLRLCSNSPSKHPHQPYFFHI